MDAPTRNVEVPTQAVSFPTMHTRVMGKVLYVDHVWASGCIVPRTMPSFVGWDSNMLKEREEWEITSGGFGWGEIFSPIRPKKNDLRIQVIKKTRIVAAGTQSDDDFYSNPDFLKVVEEIECAVHEQNALSNVPSFSLGLSQGASTPHMEHMTTIGAVAPVVEHRRVALSKLVQSVPYC
nr:uncharacterized protein LOC109174777 [Ipomoea batatas]